MTNLTRGQHPQMQKLANRVHWVTQSERRFFERFPQRRHRVGIASQAEIEQAKTCNGEARRIEAQLRSVAEGADMTTVAP